MTLHGDDDESGAIVIISFVATVPIKGRDPCSVFISIVNLFLKSVRSQLKAIIYKNRPIKILCRHKHCSYRKRFFSSKKIELILLATILIVSKFSGEKITFKAPLRFLTHQRAHSIRVIRERTKLFIVRYGPKKGFLSLKRKGNRSRKRFTHLGCQMKPPF